jgi:hypothetical protein
MLEFTINFQENPLVIAAAIVLHGLYATTIKEDSIIIKKKYMMHSAMGTSFMISTEGGRLFEVANSFWHWKWNAPELWDIIEVGDSYNIVYYGYRSPVLGMFPKIIVMVP